MQRALVSTLAAVPNREPRHLSCAPVRPLNFVGCFFGSRLDGPHLGLLNIHPIISISVSLIGDGDAQGSLNRVESAEPIKGRA
jgi:hypothetical protein